MKTVVVNIPEKKEDFFLSLLKEFRYKSRILTEEEREDMAIVKWINEGIESEDVSVEKIYEHFRKHGVNC